MPSATRDQVDQLRDRAREQIGVRPQIAACRSCQASIVWGLTDRGARAPFDVVDGKATRTNHFQTCPQARHWSRDNDHRSDLVDEDLALGPQLWRILGDSWPPPPFLAGVPRLDPIERPCYVGTCGNTVVSSVVNAFCLRCQARIELVSHPASNQRPKEEVYAF